MQQKKNYERFINREIVLENVVILRGTNESSVLVGKRWFLFIRDEPDTQVPSIRGDSVDALRYLFVTATAENLLSYNGMNYIEKSRHNIVCKLMKNITSDVLDMISIKNINNIEEIEGYKSPELIEQTLEYRKERAISLLQNIDNTLVNMIRQGDWNGFYNELGIRQGQKTLEDALIERYTIIIENHIKKIDESQEDNNRKFHQMKANEAKMKISVIQERIAEENCCICTMEFVNKVALKCEHIFCNECILTWMQNTKTCPTCRATIEYSDILVEPNSDIPPRNLEINPHQLKSKQIVVRDTIKDVLKANMGNVMLYSDSNNGLDWVKEDLNKNGIFATRLRGRAETKERIINDFNHRSGVLLLNSTNEAAGLDGLQTSFNVIIFYHQIDGAEREQIIGRLKRIGRGQKDIIIINLKEKS